MAFLGNLEVLYSRRPPTLSALFRNRARNLAEQPELAEPVPEQQELAEQPELAELGRNWRNWGGTVPPASLPPVGPPVPPQTQFRQFSVAKFPFGLQGSVGPCCSVG